MLGIFGVAPGGSKQCQGAGRSNFKAHACRIHFAVAVAARLASCQAPMHGREFFAFARVVCVPNKFASKARFGIICIRVTWVQKRIPRSALGNICICAVHLFKNKVSGRRICTLASPARFTGRVKQPHAR